LYSSFLELDNLLSSAFEFETTKGNSDSAVIKFSVAIRIFEMLGNYKILGVIYNNLGNIYLNQENYENAIRFYEKAIENASALFEGKI
jgi:tetratricopeptide (TPR) repeat protein